MDVIILSNHNQIISIIMNFNLNDSIIENEIIELGTVNKTFLITGKHKKYILQCINKNVFHNPLNIINNAKCYLKFSKKETESNKGLENWIIPKMYNNSYNKQYYHTDNLGNIWRLYDYIDGVTYSRPNSLKQVSEMGIALAKLHNLLKNIPPNRITPFSQNFHNIKSYYSEYKTVLRKNILDSYCEKIVSDNYSYIVTNLPNINNLTLQIIHGDPKIGNMIFDASTQSVISIIDFDTFYYAPIITDISDCLRSITNSQGDVPKNYENVEFNLDILITFLKSYKKYLNIKLTQMDIISLSKYVVLLPFELGLRFYTDYLNGNVYFPVKNSTDNLEKAKAQFKLFEEMSKANLFKIIPNIIGG